MEADKKAAQYAAFFCCLLFFNPLDRLGMGPVSVGDGSRALAWLLSSEGSVGSVGGVLQSLGCDRWIASAADKGGFPLICYILILRRFLGVLLKVV